MSCPVCFNAAASDETVRASMNLGIFVLMGVTGVVLAGFLRFIMSIVRLSKAHLKVCLYGHESHDHPTDVEAGLQAGLPI